VDMSDAMRRFRTTRPLARLRRGDTSWYRIENHADSADVYLYDEIGYWGVSAKDFVDEISAIGHPHLTLHINSPGGEVFDGVAIYNAIKSHPANVTVKVDGLAASAASFIAMAGDTVEVAKNATMMIHDGLGMCIGNAADMRVLADLLDKTSDNIASIYAERAGGAVETWREAMRAETWYTASEAVEAKLADRITGQAEPEPDEGDNDEDAPESETENCWDLSVFRYAGRNQAPNPVLPKPVDYLDTFRRAFEEAAA